MIEVEWTRIAKEAKEAAKAELLQASSQPGSADPADEPTEAPGAGDANL